MTDPNTIEVTHVSKTFVRNGVETLAMHDVSLSIREGEFCVVIGPSGCGKSTLLNMVSGLDMPTHGSISFFGQTVTGINTSVGYLTQADTPLPWADVFTNIPLPLTPRARRETTASRQPTAQALVPQAG